MRDEAKTAPASDIFYLKKSRTGEKVPFTQFAERKLNALLKNRENIKFDASRLEAEYDYDTD